MSNRSRAASAPRKGRTLLAGQRKTFADKSKGNAAIDLRHSLAPVVKTTATYHGRRQSTQARIPKAWSDTYHEPAPSIEYSTEYVRSLSVRAAYHNPRKPTANASTLRYQEWSDRAGIVITKQKRIDLRTSDGKAEEYQAPAKRMLWRGEATLFDDCTSVDSKNSNGLSRHFVRGEAYRTDAIVEDSGFKTTKSRLSHVISKVEYHKLDQPLPAWNVRQIDKPAKIEAIAAVHAWRMAKQEAHALALIELASRS